MCRETEIGYLESFLSTHVESHIPGSLYISGPPGTGKTATLMYLLDQMEVDNFVYHYFLIIVCFFRIILMKLMLSF